MSWENQLKGDSLSWLLETDSPGVRYLAMRDLLDYPQDNPELREACKAAHTIGPIVTILSKMEDPGYWSKPGPGYNPKYWSTVWSIILLAQLGASVDEDERIARACTYLLDHALTPGGQFSITGAPSGTIDCLQGNLCWAMIELGYEDPRLESAFEWMARTVTGEGIAPASEKHAEVRYYAYKCGPTFACGPNLKLPCAWGGTKVMLALGKLPIDRRTPIINKAIENGVDFLFSVDPATANYPSGMTGKPSQSWLKFGFPVFYVTDILQVVEALIGLGYGNNPRLANALTLIREKQNEQGRWLLEYDYSGKTWVDFGAKKQPNKWVTLRALRVLKATA
ncbi:MAG: nitrogen fixation protein NifH [Chloroflexota bacterium]